MEKKEGMPTIGFIGQGFVGKNHADDFERRGFSVVRYSLEKQFIGNKSKIKTCDVVFIAVPTPTTENGFSDALVCEVVSLVKVGGIAVIKSTVVPGTTEKIQKLYPRHFVLHAPEFLSEATAARDAAFPERNIVGIPKENKVYRDKAELVLSTFPRAPFTLICGAREAELIKYARNCMGYARVVMANIFFDLAQAVGARWQPIEDAISADPFHGPIYARPMHKDGRGAGGHCFIKDFAALHAFYEAHMSDARGAAVLDSLEKKNIELLISSGKDERLVRGVYGDGQRFSRRRRAPKNKKHLS